MPSMRFQSRLITEGPADAAPQLPSPESSDTTVKHINAINTEELKQTLHHTVTEDIDSLPRVTMPFQLDSDDNLVINTHVDSGAGCTVGSDNMIDYFKDYAIKPRENRSGTRWW